MALKLVLDMQNDRHSAQNADHTAQNDGHTMQNVVCTTHNVGRNKLNVCQDPILKKTLVSRNGFLGFLEQKNKK